MKRLLLLLGVVLIGTTVMGCGTILRGGMDGTYRGTQIDVYLIGFAGDSQHRSACIGRVPLIVGGIVDLPISVVTDTLFLPYDLCVKEDKRQATAPPPVAAPAPAP